MENLFFQRNFFASAADCNAQQRLALPVLVTNIIEVATEHANSLHIGNPDMAHINGGWVLSRLTIELFRHPVANEAYSLKTWVESWNRHFSQRAFAILDANGEPFGYARTIWAVIDLGTHKNLGLSHFQLSESLVADIPCPIPMQRKHSPVFQPGDTRAIPGSLLANCRLHHYRFKYTDLDFYRHVNTVRYIELLLNQFTLQEMDQALPSRFEIAFHHEAAYGQTVDINRYDVADAEKPDTTVSAFTLIESDNPEASPFIFARIARSPYA